MRDTSLTSNVLRLFLGCDKGLFLNAVISDGTPKIFLTENLQIAVSEALENLKGNSAQALPWESIFYILGDLPAPTGIRASVESVILAIDLVPLAENPDLCVTILYAASLQTINLGSRREGMKDMAGRRVFPFRDSQ